ncbi:hypothetical protein PsYK624_015670 [Phanerochaete sordida]|uniref:Uncharacterized protein n=1 Tax=Phanerochaete sordida TaxID=48140 RepID=A0A9P3FYC8_9APHY|nr:hypothetical protein PsYK624_015670 [Phanerochaete sordida]
MRTVLSMVLIIAASLPVVVAAPLPSVVPSSAPTTNPQQRANGVDKRAPGATIWGTAVNMCVAGGQTAHVTIEDVENRAKAQQ